MPNVATATKMEEIIEPAEIASTAVLSRMPSIAAISAPVAAPVPGINGIGIATKSNNPIIWPWRRRRPYFCALLSNLSASRPKRGLTFRIHAKILLTKIMINGTGKMFPKILTIVLVIIGNPSPTPNGIVRLGPIPGTIDNINIATCLPKGTASKNPTTLSINYPSLLHVI